MISSLGRGRYAHLDAVRKGRSGIRLLQNFDTTGFVNPIGGEVDDSWLAGESADYDRFSQFALIAAREAVDQARLEESSIDPTRVATLIGTGLGGCSTLDAAYLRLYGSGQSRVHPMAIPRSMYNAATSAVSRAHHSLGPAYAVVSACASGTHSIGQAMHWIRNGMADVALAGASDAPLVPGIVRAWEGMRVLAPEDGAAERACRPFSVDRKGLVLAEGAAVLVLESAEHASKRGATVLGEINGFGLSSDAGHLTDPSVDGAVRAIRAALADARLHPDAIGYVNAHGTATKANDASETKALKEVLGARAGWVPISSTKSMHGHAMGASGAIEMAMSFISLRAGLLPPTLHWTSGDPECDLDYVPNEARSTSIEHFLSNSFGFGGMNAVLAACVYPA